MSKLKIFDFDSNREKWDAFVRFHSDGSLEHHSAWLNVLTETYGHQSFCITLETAKGEIQGLIPFIAIERFLTAKRVVSLPFTDSCDPILPGLKSEELISFILQEYPDIDYIELKLLHGRPGQFRDMKRTECYLTHILDLQAEQDELLKSFHNTSVRQRIKRAGRNDLEFRIATAEGDLRKFYQLLTGVRKKHGLPPQPYTFYKNMWKFLKPYGFIHLPVVEHKGRMIAAAILVNFKDKFHLKYSASDFAYLKLCPNQMLIWECIKMAHNAGARYFDFGRTASGNHSLLEFKDRWGTKRYPFTYCYYPKDMADVCVDGLSRKVFAAMNRYLPASVLQLQGRLLYPYMS